MTPSRAEILDRFAPHMLAHFLPANPGAQIAPLGNHGGFSGARIWHCRVGDETYCLRTWPQGVPGWHVEYIHSLMRKARAAGLDFVPRVLPCGDRTTVFFDGLCELTSWQPGEPCSPTSVAEPRVRAACTALARLHLAWSLEWSDVGPCPAIARRREVHEYWTAILSKAWEPPFSARIDDRLADITHRAWRRFLARLAEIPKLLAPWTDRVFDLQACHCDPWHAHILFIGDTVSGIIDYGSVKQDHVAVDLARLLGDCARENQSLWDAGFDAYCRVRPLSLDEQALVPVLDRTGVVLGVANWLKWLYRDGRVFENCEEVARRLTALVERMETW